MHQAGQAATGGEGAPLQAIAAARHKDLVGCERGDWKAGMLDGSPGCSPGFACTPVTTRCCCSRQWDMHRCSRRPAASSAYVAHGRRTCAHGGGERARLAEQRQAGPHALRGRKVVCKAERAVGKRIGRGKKHSADSRGWCAGQAKAGDATQHRKGAAAPRREGLRGGCPPTPRPPPKYATPGTLQQFV